MSFKKHLRALDYRLARLQAYLAERKAVSSLVVALFLVLSVALGITIRAIPFNLNGFEFFEFDSYIEYWQAKYVYEHGLLSWYSLTRSNPDTHVFWYPWGRDFIYTSYPFLPIWIGLTYHLAEKAGFTLQAWAAIQPLVFAAVAIILAYFAGVEVTGSKIAGLVTSLITATLPAAIERSVIGFVEKEGVAAVFIYLFILFYAKMLKSIRATPPQPRRTALYMVLGALFLGMVGWLWGGYIFILGTLVAYLVLAPILARSYLTRDFVIYNLAFVILSMVFVLPSPANARTLGLYPPSIKGLGLPLLAASLIPVAYYYLSKEFRKLGLKKPVLTPGRYFLLLVLLLVIGGVLVAYGLLPIGGRLAWALGLRFVSVQPLVESIAEHQPPLARPESVVGMLHSWGVPLDYVFLIVVSPLMLCVIGALYLWYKGEPEKIYVAVAFVLAFYSYLNAAYMIATAAYFAAFTVSAVVAKLVELVLPRITTRAKRKPGIRPSRYAEHYSYTTAGVFVRILALVLVVAFATTMVLTASAEYTANSSTIYTFKAGLSGLRAYTDSWYKAVEAIRALPKDAVVISWWDYGYGISVPGSRASVADGSTINNTQIGIVGLIMVSNSTENAAELAKLFNVTPGKAYLMVIEGLLVIKNNGNITIWPIVGGTMPGIVDTPKSLWMIRIGNSVVPELRSKGINVSYVDTSTFIYLYGSNLLSPPFDKPSEIPLIYRLVVDAALYWAETQGLNGSFCWYTGTKQALRSDIREQIYENLKINVTTQVNPTGVSCTSERPLKDDEYLKPYTVIVEPFKDPRTGSDIVVSFGGQSGVLYSLILIYEFAKLP